MPGRGRRCQRETRRCSMPIRGFIAPCLLLALAEQPSHGYELVADIEPFGLGQTNPSLIYRSLRQMEQDGLVSSVWDTETGAGPARRVYQISEMGRQHLALWVQDLEETHRVLHVFIESVGRIQRREYNPT